MSPLTQMLAEHVFAGPRDHSADLVDMVRRCILDLVGAAIAGCERASAVAACNMVGPVFGAGNARIWLGATSAPGGALLCNVMAATALDIDDGHRAARGHPGAAVIPTALLLADELGATGCDLMNAIICGYDVGVRIAAAQTAEGIRTRQSGRWAAFASAATAGRLLRLEPGRLAHALAIAGVLAPNQLANGSSGYSRMTGNDVKEGIAWASVLGLTAARLAESGFTGPVDLLDHGDYYDGGRIVGSLGPRWEIADTYFKPYGCCRYIHPALDAYREIAGDDMIGADDIVEIEVQTFAWAGRLANRTDPQTLVDVQYSLPYCMALIAVDGPQALAPLDEGVLGRRELQMLAGKVRISIDPDLDRSFPAQTLARVILRTRTLELVSAVHTPRGEKTRPMDWRTICNKFEIVTRHRLRQQEQRRIIEAVSALPCGAPAALIAALEPASAVA